VLFGGSGKWHPISTAPFRRDLEVRVAGDHGPQRVPFPCRRDNDGWMNADLGIRVELVDAVDWRIWPDGA
jgi:hypothetical protein